MLRHLVRTAFRSAKAKETKAIAPIVNAAQSLDVFYPKGDAPTRPRIVVGDQRPNASSCVPPANGGVPMLELPPPANSAALTEALENHLIVE